MRISLGRLSLARKLALWLGIVALTVQGFMPLCIAGAVAASAASGGQSIVICTAHGFQTIQLDADGNPLPGSPAPDHSSSDCPLCIGCHLGGGLIAPALAAFERQSVSHYERAEFTQTPAPSRPPHLSYVSRAPPALPHSTEA